MKRLIAYNAASPLFLQLHFHFVYHFSIEVFVASAFLWALLFLDVWFPCIKLSTIFFRFVYALQALVFLITKKKKKNIFSFRLWFKCFLHAKYWWQYTTRFYFSKMSFIVVCRYLSMLELFYMNFESHFWRVPRKMEESIAFYAVAWGIKLKIDSKYWLLKTLCCRIPSRKVYCQHKHSNKNILCN